MGMGRLLRHLCGCATATVLAALTLSIVGRYGPFDMLSFPLFFANCIAWGTWSLSAIALRRSSPRAPTAALFGVIGALVCYLLQRHLLIINPSSTAVIAMWIVPSTSIAAGAAIAGVVWFILWALAAYRRSSAGACQPASSARS